MIHVTHFIFWMRPGFINRVWLAVAISLFSCAASAETYPVSGVWIARDDRFPGSANGACFILKKIGIDAVSSQPFPRLMIFGHPTLGPFHGYLLDQITHQPRGAQSDEHRGSRCG